MFAHLIITLLAALGFSIALYVYRAKNGTIPLLCPITKHHCDDVVHSRYAKLFGIPLEFLGMAYYAVIAVAHLIFILGGWETNILLVITLGLSLVAFFFSLYLTGIQAFILREWCSWCLMSASICTAIALIAFQTLF